MTNQPYLLILPERILQLLEPAKCLTFPLWDSHVHIFPEKMMKAVFAFFQSRYSWSLPFPTNPDCLQKNLLEQGVEKAFTLAYTHRPGLSRPLNRWLAAYCAENPTLTPFGAVHPLDPDLSEIVTECLDLFNFPGMKLHCLVQQCRPDDEKLNPLYETVLERSKGVIIHAGSFPQPAEEHLGVNFVAALLKKYPALNLVIPHMGLNDLNAFRELLDNYSNLYLDTAFVFQNSLVKTPVEEVAALIVDYPDRVIYGSDYPFILEPLENGIKRILDLSLPENVYKKLFAENARNFLAKITQ